jgi:hypothetical protein
MNEEKKSTPIIPRAMPKNLQVDEVVRIGQGTLSAVGAQQEIIRQEAEA